MRFSQQVYQDGLPFPPPADHVLLEYSAVTHLSWVTLHGMAHSFIELCKLLCHNKAMIHEEICTSRPSVCLFLFFKICLFIFHFLAVQSLLCP